jgi:hypothetical protein
MRSLPFRHYLILRDSIQEQPIRNTATLAQGFEFAKRWLASPRKGIRYSVDENLEAEFDRGTTSSKISVWFRGHLAFVAYACIDPKPSFLSELQSTLRAQKVYSEVRLTPQAFTGPLVLVSTHYGNFPIDSLPEGALSDCALVVELLAGAWFEQATPQELELAAKSGSIQAAQFFNTGFESDRRGRHLEALLFYYKAHKRGHPHGADALASLFVRENAPFRYAGDAIEELGDRLPGPTVIVLADICRILCRWFDFHEATKYAAQGWTPDLIQRRKESWITYYGFNFPL